MFYILGEGIIWGSPSGDTEAVIIYLAAIHFDLKFLSKDSNLHIHTHENANDSQCMPASFFFFNKWVEATEVPVSEML